MTSYYTISKIKIAQYNILKVIQLVNLNFGVGRDV